MDPLTILVLLGMIGAVFAIGAPIMLFTLAAFIYVWTHAYPWFKMVGKFGARPENFIGLISISFILLLLILLVLIVLNPANMTGLWVLLPIALIVGILFIEIIIMIPVGFALIVFMVRMIKGLFRVWAGWIESVILAFRLQFIKFKIKSDTLKEGGTKGKLRAFKGEFSGDARRVRGRVSGKKETGFKGKLEALKGEFSDDVEKARGKIFRRK